jgi:glycine/D-amino acid oxidase-like deaminating enzyme
MSTQFDLPGPFDYVIVNSGCMALSTALALQRESPDAKIIIFEGSETTTASKGICRIIRTPYKDHEYVILADEAKKNGRPSSLTAAFTVGPGGSK